MGGAPARVGRAPRPPRRPAVPARLRPRPHSRLQHQHGHPRPRRARPRLRPPVALRAEDRGRPPGGAARAPVPPDRLGARHHVPRGAAGRPARAVLPGQGARGPRRGSSRGCARCWLHPSSTELETRRQARALWRRSSALPCRSPRRRRFRARARSSDTYPARSRHGRVTRRALASTHGPAGARCSRLDAQDAASLGRRSAARARARSSGSRRRCARAAAARERGRCCAVSSARAGGSAFACARARARVRRASPAARVGLEGAWKARSGTAARGDRRGRGRAPGRGRGHVRAGGSRARTGARATCPRRDWQARSASSGACPSRRLLTRAGRARRQAGLPRAERRGNVRGAFRRRCDRRWTGRSRR